MKVVVDASVAVKWGISEVDSEAAAELLRTDHELMAPELLGVEVAIDGGQMDGFLARLPQLIQTFVPDSTLIGDAAVLSRSNGHLFSTACISPSRGWLALTW